MSRRRKVAASTAVAGVLGLLVAADLAGIRYNATASMPRGFWKVTPITGTVRRGQTVAACPPDTVAVHEAAQRGYIAGGSCPHGLEPLLKTVVAVSGDIVKVTSAGIDVNGERIGNTTQLNDDRVGRPLRPFPSGIYPVPFNQVWLLSDHDKRSFDSRYFGPVPVVNVQGVAHPMWVFG